jgi:hypothetical protein
MQTTGARTSWKWFAAWAAVGALYALSLTAVPVGVFLVPVPVVGTVLLTRRASAAGGWPGLLGGVSVLLFVLAYLNVGGPGNDCNTSDTGVTTCMDEADPWPFLAIGFVLVGLAVGLFLRMRARALR